MIDLSYAQNMEDMVIEQVFAGQSTGFYIDIGGGHPVADNVTFRAYLSGWQGLVIEPQADLQAIYAPVRPRDTVLNILVGRESGTASFHLVERLHGFSTTVEAHAKGAGDFGADYKTLAMPMRRLADLCADHAPARIDLLKIDVEGAEADVIAGNDWSRFRPRLLIIEAVAPGSMEPAHEAWDPALTAAGYHFGFFDGLNRFYVAQEDAGLLERLPRSKLDWGSVRHLYEFGRAHDNPGHPDHALAKALAGHDPARLPFLDQSVLKMALQGQSFALAEQDMAMGSDAFRAALGRIAAAYDGGMILD
jgi:FkbM family methyltransferase